MRAQAAFSLHMPVAACLFAPPGDPPKFGKNAFQVCCDRLETFALGTDGEQFLFEVQVERQRSRQIERKLVLVGRGKILHGPGQRQNFKMQLDRFDSLLVGRVARLVGDKQNFSLQKRTLLIQLQNLKAFAPFRNQVHPAVRIFFGDRNDLRRASDFRNSLIQCPHHSKLRVIRQALTNHFFVTRLEDVQRQRSARQQHDFKREQRKQGHEISVRRGRWDYSDCTTLLIRYLDLRGRGEYNPIMELDGKVVAVTGASMGIGEAIAKEFVSHGANVVLLSRDTSRADAARARIGFPDRTIALSCDVRHSEEIDRVLALTLHHFKRVDVWVNNAGHGLRDSIAEVDISACHELFETNFFGALSAMQAVIPIMRQMGGGAIINISSVAGHIPLPFHATYSASKFALNAISKAARVELKDDGIHVLTVCPGYVRTQFSENSVRGSVSKNVRPSRIRGITADRVARATLQGYLKQKREVIVPWTMHVPVKLYQLFPGLVEWGMGKMAK